MIATVPSPPRPREQARLFDWSAPTRRQLWRKAQRLVIPGGSTAQPPLRQGGAGGQGQLAAFSAGLSRRRDLEPVHLPFQARLVSAHGVVIFNNLWFSLTKILAK